MNCPQWEERLNDLVDGVLSDADRREVELHLETCPGCREAVVQLRNLLQASRELPRRIRPQRDLLPDIRRSVFGKEEGPPTPRNSGAHGVAWVRWAGLAASLFVVSLVAITALRITDRPGPGLDQPTDTGTAVANRPAGAVQATAAGLAQLQAAEEAYVEATRLLLAAIEQRRDRLSPDTLAVLEKNLAIIDRAIAAVHATIEADPGNIGNGLVLTAVYRQKVELLRKFSALSL